MEYIQQQANVILGYRPDYEGKLKTPSEIHIRDFNADAPCLISLGLLALGYLNEQRVNQK